MPGRVPDVPVAVRPMMIGRTRLRVGPLRDLAQLEATIAFLRRIPGVGAVAVDAFEDRRALLALQVLRPVDLPVELSRVLGARLRSCELGADRVEVELFEATGGDARARTDATTGGRAAARDAPGRRADWADPSASPWPGERPARDTVSSTVAGDPWQDLPPATGGLFGSGPRTRTPAAVSGVGLRRRATTVDLWPAADVPQHPTPPPSAPLRPALGADALERVAGSADLVLSALESMEDVSILVFDRETRFRASAGSALKRHGHRNRDVVGRRAPDVLAAATWQHVRPGYESALAGHATTLAHRTADGVLYEVEFRPVREGTAIVGGLAISRDVTGRQGTASRLSEAGGLYEQSFLHAPIAKALISPDGRWLRVNHRLCELLGRDAATVVSCSLQELTHPDDVASDVGLNRALLEGRSTRYAVDKRYLHAAGHVVPARLEVSLVRAPDGTPRWFVFQFVALPADAAVRPRLPAETCVA